MRTKQTDEKEYRKVLEQYVASTYRNLRFVLVIIGFAFAPFLAVVGKLWYGMPLQDSMSAYYWAESPGDGYLRNLVGKYLSETPFGLAPLVGSPMRSWFVGLLFVLGIFLYVYKGFGDRENQFLNIAGVSALLVALVPMGWECDNTYCQSMNILGNEITFHGIFAITSFVSMVVVALWCAKDTLYGIPDNPGNSGRPVDQYYKITFGFRWFVWLIIHVVDILTVVFRPIISLLCKIARVQNVYLEHRTRRYYLNRYYVTGILMISFPLFAFIATLFLNTQKEFIFLLEMLGIWAFATYWTIKSMELEYTQSEIRALQQQLPIPPDPQPVTGSGDGSVGLPPGYSGSGDGSTQPLPGNEDQGSGDGIWTGRIRLNSS